MTGNQRPGRIVIGTLGLDQHEVGAMGISRILIRHGYEVIYLGRFNTPERLTAAAEQEEACEGEAVGADYPLAVGQGYP